MKRVRYLRAGMGSGGIDCYGRWRPWCFYLRFLQLGDLMCRVNRVRMLRKHS